jgi:hypothetical protein
MAYVTWRSAGKSSLTMGASRLIRTSLGAAVGAAVSTLAVLAPLGAAAQTYTEPYLIDFDATSTVDVSDVVIFNLGEHACCGYGFADSYAVPVGETVLSDGFPKTDEAAGAFLAGVTTEADSSVGAVLFTSVAFATAYAGQPFSAAFSGLSESDLVGYLEDPNDNVGNLFDFADTYGSELAFVPGDPFAEIQFSDGAVVGSGLSSEVTVPEPTAWTLMIVGLAALGGTLRGRRRSLADIGRAA